MKTLVKTAVILVSAALISASVQASTYYVATSGNDANSGSATAPFRTISKGASITQPGDSVQVRGGVYNEIVKIASRGTAAARIVVQSYPGETAIIDGTGSAAGTNLVQLNASEYVDFSGFEVRNSTRIGICGWAAKNSRVLSNVIHDSQKGGVYFGYSSFGATYDNTVDGNTLYHNVLENQFHTMNGGWSQTIGMNLTDRSRVTHNRVYQNDGEGIVFVMSDNGFAQGNEVFDNYSVELYLDNAQFTTIDSNLIYSSGDTRYYRSSYPAHGIGMANETYSTTNPLTDNKLTNNIILNSRWGIFYGNYQNGGGLQNTTIANNTLYSSSSSLLNIDSASHNGNVVENNIFYQGGSGSFSTVAGGGVTYRNNSWNGSAGSAAGTGDVVGDPKLANGGGLTAADYKLTSFSPLLQQGVATSTVTSDYWGAARTSGYDIGAHQLGGSTPPSTADTAAPTAPVALSISSISRSSVALSWNASSDNVGVTAYRVYRNGAVVATVTGTTFNDANLNSSTTFTYQVSAIDAAANESVRSNNVSATTLSKRTRTAA